MRRKMSELVYYEMDGTTAVVTLNHPPVNALDIATKEALWSIFKELEKKAKELRAVVIIGSGAKAFAAGADIKVFLDDNPEKAFVRLKRSHEIYNLIEGYRWPVIAAIQGYCLGAGLELALSCDVRYADETAKFGFPETSLSIFPGNGGTKRTLYVLGLGKVKELMYSGDIIDSEEALRLGLVEKITEKGRVYDSALDLASKIAKKGPLGIIEAKKTLNQTRDLALLEALQIETQNWSRLAGTDDAIEGAKAFIKKRTPKYKGH
jgi:enoyl-CoA hydratase/carnithine racemase